MTDAIDQTRDLVRNLESLSERIRERAEAASRGLDDRSRAQQQGEHATTWREFDERADGVARALLDAGLNEQDKVAQYLYNGPEYLESVLPAPLRARLWPRLEAAPSRVGTERNADEVGEELLRSSAAAVVPVSDISGE